MEEKIISHKPLTPPRKGDIILQLTDVELHTKVDTTKNPAKRIEHAIDHQKPVRIYSSLSISSDSNIVQTPFLNFNDPEFQKLIKKYRDQGKRVFISPPKDGLPVSLGKDSEEFISSKKGKRVLRKLNKDKDN
jgi:hypothetical protein